MSKIGRNDPCPCGSGKKYKHCCMRKEQAAAHARPSAPSLQPPPDSHTAALNARWEEFEAANYEARIALFHRTLDEGLMDEEMAFEMLTSIRPQAQERGEWSRFEELLDRLQAEAPELYARDFPYYTHWRIENALLRGDTAAIPNLVMAFAEEPDRDIDEFFNVIDLLMYHNQVSALIAAMTTAWPKVKRSADIVPQGIDEFAEILSGLIIFDYLEQTPNPRPDDPALVERLAPYADTDPARLGRNLAALTGQSGKTWSLDDFGPRVNGDTKSLNLFLLSLEFLGELRRRAGVPYSKGELGRVQLYRYLLARQEGEYEEDRGLLAMLERPHRKRRKPVGPRHPLCPEHLPFDRFLGELLSFINPQFYKAGCVMELVPAWADFLARRGLITASEAEAMLAEIRPLAGDLIKALRSYRADPLLIQSVKEAWGMD